MHQISMTDPPLFAMSLLHSRNDTSHLNTWILLEHTMETCVNFIMLVAFTFSYLTLWSHIVDNCHAVCGALGGGGEGRNKMDCKIAIGR